jgi:citrate lyase beta subunit
MPAHADDRLADLVALAATRRTRLPLRYLVQTAHFTTPLSDPAVARKAVDRGTASVARMLERLELAPKDLADRLGVRADRVAAILVVSPRAPLVILDAEDSIAPAQAAADAAGAIAADVLVEADWSAGAVPTLRAFRPPALADGGVDRVLVPLLRQLSERTGHDPAAFPLDIVVIPKIQHPEEVAYIHDVLDDAERDLGLSHGRIRVAYLIESGWAVEQLPAIAARAADRLAALILGLADLSADLGLPEIESNHPVAAMARTRIVSVAGAVGVPAIDGMTLRYPVVDPELDADANRERFLKRMRLVFDEAVAARDLGMSGKWVGHPAQLLAVLLAFDDTAEDLEAEAAKLETYTATQAHGRGVAMIDGVMSDRATDRHARTRLRIATAHGRFDPERALALGVIDQTECDEMTARSSTRRDPSA